MANKNEMRYNLFILFFPFFFAGMLTESCSPRRNCNEIFERYIDEGNPIDRSNAARILDEAIDCDPNEIMYLEEKVSLSLIRGRYQDASAANDKLLQLDSNELLFRSRGAALDVFLGDESGRSEMLRIVDELEMREYEDLTLTETLVYSLLLTSIEKKDKALELLDFSLDVQTRSPADRSVLAWAKELIKMEEGDIPMLMFFHIYVPIPE